ncbi:hypothetical protein OAF74_02320 [bacterium]|jgi:hypothetical protein|nr:hypothetical protein [bacterium]
MSKHSEHSVFREKLVEHLFVGELLKYSWLMGNCTLELASPEVDNSGYDLIAEDRGVVRHIQLKSTFIGAKTSRQKIHTRLAEKSSGCMVWLCFDSTTLQLGPFLFFGGAPGEQLPDLDRTKVARHTKGDQTGYKAERPRIREINKGLFTRYENIQDVYNALFGQYKV